MPRPKNYSEMIDATTPEQVLWNVRNWSSELTEEQHLVRSIVLTIHANLEDSLKDVLYQVLHPLISRWPNRDKEYQDQTNALEKRIRQQSFSQVFELLKPALQAFDSPDFVENLAEINILRNAAAHSSEKELNYRNRKLYGNHELLAELFVNAWSLKEELAKFKEKMIHDPLELQRVGRNVYAGASDPLARPERP